MSGTREQAAIEYRDDRRLDETHNLSDVIEDPGLRHHNLSDNADESGDEELNLSDETDESRVPGPPTAADSEPIPTGESTADANMPKREGDSGQFLKRVAIGAGIGVLGVLAVPVGLGAIGFTAGGIAANSIAAGMMSSAAIANGGGIAAGGLVATLQSVGAAGLAAGTQAAVVGAGASAGAVYDRIRRTLRR